jgi:hypothetical protein
MTETTTNTQAAPPGILLTLIVALLAPMFLGVTAGDIALARMAAVQTINDYRAQNRADLMAVAQIVACGLAALGSLSLSMADEISLSMTLRLRGNAVALNRSAEQNRRALAKTTGPAPYQPERPATSAEYTRLTEAEVFLTATAARELSTESEARLHEPEQTTPSEKRIQQMWAIAMVSEASEITASIPTLPPAEQRIATMRAAALNTTANHLLYGAPMPPIPQGYPEEITQPNPNPDRQQP